MTVNNNEEMLKKLNAQFTTKKLFGACGDNPGNPAAEYLMTRNDFSDILSKAIKAGMKGFRYGYTLDYGFCVVLYNSEKDVYVVIADTVSMTRPLPVESIFGIQYVSDTIEDVLAYIAAVYW